MKKRKPDTSDSIEALEGADWGAPAEAPTPLIRKCLTLRKVPLQNLQPADIRLLLGQEIGLPFLVPIALEMLKEEPLLETDFYEGDLLKNILQIDAGFWKQYPNYQEELHSLIKDLLPDLEARKIPFQTFLEIRNGLH